MSIQLTRHRFTADEYHQMAEAGVLRDDDRVELIEGEILDMMPIGPRHSAVVNRINRALVRGCGDRAIVQIQASIRLGLYSEPQLDVAPLKPRSDFYETAVPGPESVLLLIEVADTSLLYDRGSSSDSTPGRASARSGSSISFATTWRSTAKLPKRATNARRPTAPGILSCRWPCRR
jgi:Putative restriction endonuclease